MDEGSLWVSGILFVVVGLPVIIAVWKFGLEPAQQVAGLFKINDFVVDKIRLAVIANCQAIKTGGLSEEEIVNLFRETARHTIAKTFAEVYRKRQFKVTNSWPDASVIITGNIAVLKLWIGHDFSDDGEGIRAITVDIDRKPALKLDTRKTIKAALGESHGLPTNRTDTPRSQANGGAKPGAPGERAEPQKASVQGSKPAPKRANLRKI